jgi:hypothetical protein
MWLYPNYRVDARGPSGCIMDALAAIAPKIHRRLAAGEEPRDVYKRWSKEEDT